VSIPLDFATGGMGGTRGFYADCVSTRRDCERARVVDAGFWCVTRRDVESCIGMIVMSFLADRPWHEMKFEQCVLPTFSRSCSHCRSCHLTGSLVDALLADIRPSEWLISLLK